MVSEEQTRDVLRQKVVGSTINNLTLLSTDYCNHLGEVVMMISITADMPELIDDVKSWQPKSYEDHFDGSGLSISSLAIQCYQASEAKFREPFDREVQAFDALVASGCAELVKATETNDAEFIAFSANGLSKDLQEIIDRIAAIANGAILDTVEADDEKGSLNQDDIDAMF
jgi:hypothetical protein